MFSSADAKFVVLAFSSLFSVINPIEAAPLFVSLTAGAPQDRRKMALRASSAAALILAFFALTGGAIFSAFGITLPAFQIAGGILFTSMGLHTLGEDERPERTSGVVTRDPSIVPLGMPLIAGQQNGPNEVGYKTINGIEALEKILAQAFDLVVVDVNMPRMDGFSFIRELRATAGEVAGLPALVITTEDAQQDREDARTAGANFYLVKPVSEADLLRYAAILAGVPA